ncbi:MAG: hypothetical protein LM601_08700 [Candidatus Verstraetearchaeota archaeon]|nr:hypothetical protein [Candidatus Verstraetearchaeota archaeon]
MSDIELYYQLAINEYGRSAEMFYRLREHASVILGVDALILTLVSTILSTSLSRNLNKTSIPFYLVILGILCFLISVSFVLSIFWPRRWDILLVSPEGIIKLYKQGELKKEDVAEELLIIAHINMGSVRRHSIKMKISIITTWFGLIFLSSGVVLSLS